MFDLILSSRIMFSHLESINKRDYFTKTALCENILSMVE